MVSNAILIYALYSTKQLNSITNKLILLMSISDFLMGIFSLPTMATMIALKDTFRSCTFERIVQYFAYMLAYFSFFMLMFISLDRYVHVTKLNRYSDFINEFRMKIATIVCFLITAIVAYITISLPSFVLQVVLNCSNLLGVILMCTLYAVVFRKIQYHAENYKRMLGNVSKTEANKNMQSELSATKTIRLVLVALLVQYLPYNIVSAFWAYHKMELREDPGLTLSTLEYLALLIVFSNHTINAAIFAYGNSKTRKFINNMVYKSANVDHSSFAESRKDASNFNS